MWNRTIDFWLGVNWALCDSVSFWGLLCITTFCWCFSELRTSFKLHKELKKAAI